MSVQLVEIVDRMQGAAVLVVGDAIFDQYHWGTVSRMCPEAPVPVFVESKEERRPGGAANVAHNLMALGCDPACVFPQLDEWSVKHRFMADSHLLLRVDDDRTAKTPPGRAELEDIFESHRPKVVVVSDYGKGFVTPMLMAKVVELATPYEPGAKIIVDPKGSNWLKYHGADIVTPNQKEFEEWDGRWRPETIVRKRGAQGLSILGAEEIHIPAVPSYVFDVTGAGDTVVAVMAAGLATGATLEDACRLAVLAASYVVAQVGTATCPAVVLRGLAAQAAP